MDYVTRTTTDSPIQETVRLSSRSGRRSVQDVQNAQDVQPLRSEAIFGMGRR
jgi:hypothetical protein